MSGDEKDNKDDEADLILSNMTEAEKEEFRYAFKLFDKDDDGKITVDEIYTVFSQLGFSQYNKNDIKKMLKAVDTDGNGTIDIDEFIVLLRSKKAAKFKNLSYDDELKQAFNVFDLDGNGQIEASELSSVMKALGENLSLDDINFMIKAIDTDSNGQIDFGEFKKMMQLAPIPQETLKTLDKTK